ncbi:hypothetical protein V6N13_099813 [Hibiscus sabdariffa]
MSPKYIAGPISSRSKARFVPHMGKRVPFGTVMIASTYLNKRKQVLNVVLQGIDRLPRQISGNLKDTKHRICHNIFIGNETCKEEPTKQSSSMVKMYFFPGNKVVEASASRVLKGNASSPWP